MLDNSLNITFWTVVKAAILLTLGYLLLRLAANAIQGMSMSSKSRAKIDRWLNGVLSLYVPIAIIIVVIASIFWQQRLIGVPAILCLILFYMPLSNFFLGLLVRAKNDLKEGKGLKIGDVDGQIIRWGSTEVKIATAFGRVSVPYRRLYKEGYTVSTTANSSRSTTLRVTAGAEARDNLADIIAGSPYVRYDIPVKVTTAIDGNLDVQYVPKVEEYNNDIKNLILNAGYEIK